ncbi:hypothetical protein BDA99DRAFT_132110 [Phascolomyces articulosus]|uniref:Uncharacterized protein n=1 Tax=Phascolomyces articulosus TaxID=60185 RepID=A0AAD5PC92_9FUNG|nr:hypothetical protein BDA99DRAFT_132110 [Phascolomyces articulosus]
MARCTHAHYSYYSYYYYYTRTHTHPKILFSITQPIFPTTLKIPYRIYFIIILLSLLLLLYIIYSSFLSSICFLSPSLSYLWTFFDYLVLVFF